tara:strand:- start:1433 stop:1603 length:171 start_codon:yes stop_codon:yes gene_type:complete
MPNRPLFNLEDGRNPKIGSVLSANFSSILLAMHFSETNPAINSFHKITSFHVLGEN